MRKFITAAIILVSGLCIISCRNDAKGGKVSEKQAIEFLEQVYPNLTDDEMAASNWSFSVPVMTDRCGTYTDLECDFDPIWCTQDGYAFVKPQPRFSKHAGIANAYDITWQMDEGTEHTNTVILVVENGFVLIDNFLNEDGTLMFDYSKEPVSIWDE